MSSQKCFLGVDLGAESGRVMAGLWDGTRMALEELHRFPNGPVDVGQTRRWNVEGLWQEIEKGLALAAQRFGDSIVSIGVDTWGVDYVLLNREGALVEQPWSYRDGRTRGMLEKVRSRISHEEIFAASGVQLMEFNTLYQLLAQNESHPEVLAGADTFLMIPDYLHYKMCGRRACEFTNATTTQMLHPTTKLWSVEMLQRLGLPTSIFPEVVAPGTTLGLVSEELRQRTGLGAHVRVIAPATHDTGSAVAGVPKSAADQRPSAYLSSGTWSLLGVEVAQPQLGPKAFTRNFTNEGGLDGTYRLLKNIMGLWLIQQCRRSFAKKGGTTDYAELVRAAESAPAFRSLIDPDAPCFFDPPDMPTAIAEFCSRTHQPIPQTEGQLVRCALESLALKYSMVLGWLQELTGQTISLVNIVGGGSRNRLLNQLTANACNATVLAGPVEATVLGNLLVQARSSGEFHSLDDLRQACLSSSQTEVFSPTDNTTDVFQRFSSLV